MLLVRFLSDLCTSLEVNWGQRTTFIELSEHMELHLNVEYLFDKSAVRTSKQLGRVDIRVGRGIFR